jgi:hypothetical protein
MGLGVVMGRTYKKRADSSPPGLVRATCWCEKEVVWIPVAWLGIRTDHCERPACIEMAAVLEVEERGRVV